MKLHLTSWLVLLILALAIRAQPANILTGEWVGNVEANGKTQFISVSFKENAGRINVPLAGFSADFSSVRLADGQVRCELNDKSVKLLLTGAIFRDEIQGEAESPGTKGTFHLLRSKRLAPEVIASYAGAYRFRDGGFLLLDSLPDMPNTLIVTDARSGEVRGFFPDLEGEFFSGPALFVAHPVSETLSFRKTQNGGTGLELRRAQQPIKTATRLSITREEVRFKNGGVVLAGTLIVPPGKRTRHPAVVFTHGGGAAVRELFWGLGYFYAANGIAILTYDKRGVGGSSGNWREASFEDLADDAVAGARFLQSRADIDSRRIGFWGLSQGGWIAPLAAARFRDSAFAIASSGGGLSPAEQEVFDTSYELRKAGFTQSEINDAVTFQKLKNEIIRSSELWNKYASARLVAKEQKWFRFPGIDVRGPDKSDDPFWTNLRRFYFYDPSPTLRTLKCPLLAIFGELDTPDAVKANVHAIRQALDSAGKRNYVVKVYPNSRHNLMEVPLKRPEEFVEIKRFVPGLFQNLVGWTLTQVKDLRTLSRAGR